MKKWKELPEMEKKEVKEFFENIGLKRRIANQSNGRNCKR